MAKIYKNDDFFILISDNLKYDVTGFNDVERLESIFQGYCFVGDQLEHSKLNSNVDLKRILNNYHLNCGVFSAVLESNGETTVFTDSLGQYPVFYYCNKDEFIISNDFWNISYLLGDIKEINASAMPDYISYFSILGQETLLKNVKRLTCYQKIIIQKDSENKDVFTLLDEEELSLDSSYDVLIQFAAQRFKDRASAVLNTITPITHLSGGVDSRLSCSALMTQGYKGPVFSYGDGTSQDRLIFEELCADFSLKKEKLTSFNGVINSTGQFLKAVSSFNGLKTTNFNNWTTYSDFTYGEVTGYFSGGLLKGFGNINIAGRGDYFSYARKISTFEHTVFDISDERMGKEYDFLLDKYSGNKLRANQMMYLRNRSAAHFGANSALNNQKLVSIDILYDPILVSLTQKSPYSYNEINKSLIAIDLIKELHSQELAYFPYDNRVIDNPRNMKKDMNKGINCFNDLRFLQKDLKPIGVNYISNKINIPKAIEDCYLSNIKSFNYIQEAEDFYSKYQLFGRGIENNKLTRTIEYTSAAVLAATYILLNKNHNNFNKEM